MNQSKEKTMGKFDDLLRANVKNNPAQLNYEKTKDLKRIADVLERIAKCMEEKCDPNQ